jgi:hypothetical protein
MTTAPLERPDLLELLLAALAVATSPGAAEYRDPHSTHPAVGIETAMLDRLLHAVAAVPELSDHDFEAVIPALSDTAFEALASRRLAHDPALDPRYERRIRALPPAGSDPDACRTSRRSETGADHDAWPRAVGRTRTDTVPVDELEAR